ncbi:MAG: hypothetical protein ABFD89_18415 [Bryobacteraceae bacterium]
MDRLDALIAIAHLRVRLARIEVNPDLLGRISEMEIKRPMALAAFSSRLKRAEKSEADIEVTGRRYDTVLDEIDELHGVGKAHVGQLELYKDGLKTTIERMVGGSNGDPIAGQDGQKSQEAGSGPAVGQIISSKTEGQ